MIFLYTRVIQPLLFQLPPEMAHTIGMLGVRFIGFLHRLGFWPRPKWAKKNSVLSPFGELDSPLGLAAGFDKNAQGLLGWQALGFAFVEVGTVTPMPQPGNPRPRLFRHPLERSLVNRMGFNNDGAKIIAGRIARAKKAGLKIPVGGNIGKNYVTTTENAARDYTLAALALKDVVDYLVINVSSPNTPGLRELQKETFLEKIVQPVKSAAGKIPLFIKIAPDQFKDFIEGVESVVKKYSLSGVICGNTLAGHNFEKGGLSGAPVFAANLELCKTYASRGSIPFIMGVGGIENLETAREYLSNGANLIQVYSGLVYHGPALIKNIADNL